MAAQQTQPDPGDQTEHDEPRQQGGYTGDNDGDRAQQPVPGLSQVDSEAVVGCRWGRRVGPEGDGDVRHGGLLVELGKSLGERVEVGLPLAQLALDQHDLLEVGGVREQGLHARHAGLGRSDAGLSVDVGVGHVLGLRRAVRDGPEPGQVGQHPVELGCGNAEGEPGLVHPDRGEVDAFGGRLARSLGT
ncbi:hypothetical protein BA895_10300 [Humibacillus sp. DSM 29435]|nr:hypothetical protein BA895_10300 [Humibacillus sp. DSM 29435]